MINDDPVKFTMEFSYVESKGILEAKLVDPKPEKERVDFGDSLTN